MVEEEKAAGGKAKENYVASPFSTTWAVSLSCEVLQHTFHPRRFRNIFNTQTQAKQTDRLYSTEVKNGPSTKYLETYLYFGEQTKAAAIPQGQVVGKFRRSVTIKSSLDIHIIIAVVVVVVVVEPATGELWSAAASWCTLGHTQAQAPHTVNRDCHREVCEVCIRRN